MLVVLLIGGLSTYYLFFSRSATGMHSAETAAKSATAAQPTTAASSRYSAAPSPAETPPKAPKPTPRATPSRRAGERGAGPSLAVGPVTRLCGQAGWPETRVDGGAYIVQNDEWNSTAPECIVATGGTQFAVTSSSIYEPTHGDPGGYPAIYSGCSAGVCTTGNKMPIPVSEMTPGTVTSSWATTQPASGAYDVAYDVWFNQTPATSGTPDGGELMIWLAHRGGAGIAPAGRPVASATIDGHAYTVWLGPGNPGSGQPFDQISYVMKRAATSVQDLDISDIAADAARRGYLAGTSYLVNVQAGFEIWQGGRGLETQSFSVNVRR